MLCFLAETGTYIDLPTQTQSTKTSEMLSWKRRTTDRHPFAWLVANNILVKPYMRRKVYQIKLHTHTNNLSISHILSYSLVHIISVFFADTRLVSLGLIRSVSLSHFPVFFFAIGWHHNEVINIKMASLVGK